MDFFCLTGNTAWIKSFQLKVHWWTGRRHRGHHCSWSDNQGDYLVSSFLWLVRKLLSANELFCDLMNLIYRVSVASEYLLCVFVRTWGLGTVDTTDRIGLDIAASISLFHILYRLHVDRHEIVSLSKAQAITLTKPNQMMHKTHYKGKQIVHNGTNKNTNTKISKLPGHLMQNMRWIVHEHGYRSDILPPNPVISNLTKTRCNGKNSECKILNLTYRIWVRVDMF